VQQVELIVESGMLGSRAFEAIARLFGRRPYAPDRPSWGQQNPIDILADRLIKDPEGWIRDGDAIRRSGIEIAWKGALSSASTTISVTMDGKKFPVRASEGQNLKYAVSQLLSRSANRG
jgi:hypothetical protein